MTITDAAVSVRPTPAAEMESTPGRTEGSSWNCASQSCGPVFPLMQAGAALASLPALLVGKHDELGTRGSLPQGLDVVDRPCRPWRLRFAC